ncbi:MAG: glycosyltransferase family 2 protein [Candidatus Omnitrophica bacterium]|nr:glycosyltransferase family 2 protein [Candidatus Omnitrophota bacterium]MDD5079228.1 glycosyltransferase family 2 protein [Candidatus Omnitrophota bacterium]
MRTCVLIPTHNEAKNIAALVENIRGQKMDILVIDDGSSDNTAGLAEDNGAEVIKNPRNLGKGASLIKGFEHILTAGFDACITMDGDGQHRPEEISSFIQEAANSDAGIIIGNRMAKSANMPLIRVFTNKFMSWLISKIARQDICDSQCGFRLIRKEVLKKIKLHSAKFEIESEIIIEASRNGFKIASVPITSVYINETSHINPVTDTLRFLRFLYKRVSGRRSNRTRNND